MAYVTPIYGGSAAQVDYRLGISQPGHGCASDAQFRYHADGRERPLRWIGRGLPAFGVDGVEAGAELTAEQFDLAGALMAGKHLATGEQLVAPKVAVPADAKVPLGPLVAAVKALAAERGITDPAALFSKPKQRSAWNTALRAVTRRGDAALLRVDDALALAEAAGLEAEQVWPDTDLIEVYSNLFESTVVRGEDGTPVLDAEGMPTYELTPRRVPVGIVGFDIGITLPKSASLLLAFLPDEVINRVESGYTEAIERTFGWVEDRTSYVRRGKHGDGHTARTEQTAGFSGWVMTHRAARPVGDATVGDPHWHVHITIANMAQAPDGTWLTVAAGGRDLMRHAPAIDKVTQAQVRASLHRELGITFTRSPRTGIWEVAQIPDEAIVYFSKRGHQVTEVLKQLGYNNADVSAAEARIITRESRSAKSETTAASDATLRGLWRGDALRGRFDPDALMDAVLTAYRTGQSAAPGKKRARGAWGKTSVYEILKNPKYTGYQVFNRRASRSRGGKVNDPRKWVWSKNPTHEPLIPKWMYDELTARRQAKKGSRDGNQPNTHPQTRRTYVFRSMIIHDCGRRMNGNHRHNSAYYMCHPKNGNRGRPDKYAGHVKAAYIREDLIMDAVSAFYADRVFGSQRRELLAAQVAGTDDRETRQREAERERLQRTLADLARRQNNVMRQAQDGDPDDPFTQGLRQTYNDLEAERRAALAAVAELDAVEAAAPARASAADVGLIDALPYLQLNLNQAPELLLRSLFETTHLAVRLHPDADEITITIRLPADDLPHRPSGRKDHQHHAQRTRQEPPGQPDPGACADAVRAPAGFVTELSVCRSAASLGCARSCRRPRR